MPSQCIQTYGSSAMAVDDKDICSKWLSSKVMIRSYLRTFTSSDPWGLCRWLIESELHFSRCCVPLASLNPFPEALFSSRDALSRVAWWCFETASQHILNFGALVPYLSRYYPTPRATLRYSKCLAVSFQIIMDRGTL